MSEFKRITNDKIDLIESEYPKNMWVKMGAKAQLASCEADQKEERRALGEWLDEKAGIIFDQQADDSIFEASLEALKRGELPEGMVK
jgi:hypothetical protein